MGRIVQMRCSTILAMLFNRLAANALPDSWRPDGRIEVTKVRMTRDGPALTTPQDLLAALLEPAGTELHMQIVSRVTGLGAGAPLPRDGTASGHRLSVMHGATPGRQPPDNCVRHSRAGYASASRRK